MTGRHAQHRPWSVFIVMMLLLTAILALSSAIAFSLARPSLETVTLPDGATVYYNSACGDCVMYITDTLMPTLTSQGIDSVTLKDWTNHVSFREELYRLHQQTEIQTSLMSHLTAFVKRGNLVVFEGHVPSSLLVEAVALNETTYPRLVVSVWDDGMTGDTPAQYGIWAFAGEPQVYPTSTPVTVYTRWLGDSNVKPWTPPPQSPLLPLVIGAGFIDGLNPCAFAVLLFFVSLLFATRSPAMDMVKMGSVYIYGIFVVYLMIGLGLLGAIVLSPDPHFMAKVGAVLMVAVGGITIANYFLPRIPMPFHMPKAIWETTRKWMMKATLPGATVAGLLVGLCTFPCSGTIYVFVLGLLASQTSFLVGLGYLYIYNLFFVMPLIAILLGIMAAQHVSKRPAARGFARWERAHSREIRLVSGVVMILLAAGFFIWAA